MKKMWELSRRSVGDEDEEDEEDEEGEQSKAKPNRAPPPNEIRFDH